MRKLVVLVMFVALVVPVVVPVTANGQASFILGVAVGGILFGGDTQYGAGGATILYSADQETLKAVDPLSVRMAAINGCFHRREDRFEIIKINKSWGELFAEIMADMPKTKRTILQVVRVFNAGSPSCAAIWFTYIERIEK